jgi:hypothetical protein
MDSHNEDFKYIHFGKRKLEISNIAYMEIVRMKPLWDEQVKKETFTELDINNMVNKVGLYLIRQSFAKLKERYTPLKAFWEFVKRYVFYGIKSIEKLNGDQYEEFQGWVYELVTGQKKKFPKMKLTVLDQVTNLYVEMEEKYNIHPDICKESLQILVRDQAKLLIESTKDQQV